MSNLIDQTELKAFLGITGTGSDAILEIYTDFVVAEVESYLDRTLETATYTNEILTYEFSKFDARDTRVINVRPEYGELFVQNYPISSFNMYSEGEVIDPEYYTINLTNGVIDYGKSEYELTATYVAGYTESTLPVPLKLVIFEGVKEYYQNGGAGSQGSRQVESKKVGDFSVKYESEIVESAYGVLKRYIASNQSILNRYMRISV